jgi:TIGR03009 family protein
MRRKLLALAGLLALAALVSAQSASPVAKPAANPALDKHLKAWEEKMRGVSSLYAVITKVDSDKVFKTETKMTGYALYSKSGAPGAVPLNKARLELTPDGKKEPAVKIISTGTFLYQYVPGKKEIHQHEIARPKAGAPMEDNFLGLVFGMKAEDAKARYDLSLLKEDDHYVYVEVLPKSAADKAEFIRARLVLNKANYLPRQLMFEEANKNTVLWDLPRAEVPKNIDPRYFDAPRADPGWKIVPVTKATSPPPRVIRDGAGK